jgi:hypothetical protein
MKASFFTLLLLTLVQFVMSQGCSDAGFCSLKYAAGAPAAKNSFSIGTVAGGGDGNTFVNNSYLSYTRQFSGRLFWDTKITANYASGSLAANFNVGDIFTTLSAKAWQSPAKQQKLIFLTGVKIPLTAANDKAGGKPLPMSYQASLGTFDLLLGASYQLNNWEFTNAWQLPLTGENKNSFIDEYSIADDFPSSNKLKRKADVLLRAAYNFQKKGSRFAFKPNLLAVYHLGNDSYENIFSKRQILTGSKGLTVNANVIGKYLINATNSIGLSVAAPLVVRTIRPDGLTRSFTAGIEYKFSF